jgi:hypothetical protein
LETAIHKAGAKAVIVAKERAHLDHHCFFEGSSIQTGFLTDPRASKL